MFNWALFFLIFALIAGILGFTGMAGTAAGIAKVLFYVGLTLFILTIVSKMIAGRDR